MSLSTLPLASSVSSGFHMLCASFELQLRKEPGLNTLGRSGLYGSLVIPVSALVSKTISQKNSSKDLRDVISTISVLAGTILSWNVANYVFPDEEKFYNNSIDSYMHSAFVSVLAVVGMSCLKNTDIVKTFRTLT